MSGRRCSSCAQAHRQRGDGVIAAKVSRARGRIGRQRRADEQPQRVLVELALALLLRQRGARIGSTTDCA